MGGHQVPRGDLGRARAAVDLGCAGRRGRVHGVHLPGQGRARHRPPDRAPRQATQPQSGQSGPGRAVRGLPPPRRVHRLTPGHARSRGLAPGHALVEQVIADLKAGPLAHAPSGDFAANGAWTVLAAIAFNLTRAAATLASAKHARARPATIRDQLVNIPARIANRARRLHLHLPTNWPWQHAWEAMFDTAYAPG
ncbi:transposase [Ornithinimicrobium panacihumi]|uniref:transposase n=1 Tax=Ornithinimicrobium panacihumi TaxID=2008449 RepID=UPI003F88D3FA